MNAQTTNCPSCGSKETPTVTKRYRRYNEHTHEIVYYSCRCGFSTWDESDYHWQPTSGRTA